jgi:hypothetical protein
MPVWKTGRRTFQAKYWNVTINLTGTLPRPLGRTA